MLICYLDDSDASTGHVSTLAGYVGDAEKWPDFERAAEEICELFDVSVIHARELDKRDGCFKGWSVPRTIRFLHGLQDAMSGTVLLGISRSLPKALYKVRKAQANLSPQLSGYGFTFGTIVFSLFQGTEFGLTEKAREEGVTFRIESGHRNNPDLERYIASEVAHGNLHPDTRIEFVGKKSSRAIQVADLYAMYSRRRANKYWRTRGRLGFFPDVLQMHMQGSVPHYTGLIEDPVRSATNLRTGETFDVTGMVTNI